LEAQHPLQDLGCEARSRFEPPPQLALRDTQNGSKRSDIARPIEHDAPRGLLDNGIDGTAGRQTAVDADSSVAAAAHAVGASAIACASDSASGPHNSSAPTVRSTSSEAGMPRTAGARPGRMRTPTRVVPGARISAVGDVRGPAMCTARPGSQVSSTLPFGTLRNVYGADAGHTRWTHTQVTNCAT